MKIFLKILVIWLLSWNSLVAQDSTRTLTVQVEPLLSTFMGPGDKGGLEFGGRFSIGYVMPLEKRFTLGFGLGGSQLKYKMREQKIKTELDILNGTESSLNYFLNIKEVYLYVEETYSWLNRPKLSSYVGIGFDGSFSASIKGTREYYQGFADRYSKTVLFDSSIKDFNAHANVFFGVKIPVKKSLVFFVAPNFRYALNKEVDRYFGENGHRISWGMKIGWNVILRKK